MRAAIVDFSLSMSGKQRLTLELDGDFREQFDQLHENPVEVTVKRYKAKRSLDANAMLWSLCDQIAKKIRTTKEEVYRDQIKQVGVFTPLPIKENAVESFSDIWAKHGIGWFVDVVDDSKLPGYKLVFAYAGSSTYDSKQMSILLDGVIQEAKSLGIDTLSERERSLLLDAWTPS